MREAGVNAPWKSNAKDVLLGSSSAQSHPSWFGHPRDKRDHSSFTYVWTVHALKILLYAPKILFRRVSPVESRRYAFFQNFCALLFVVAIIVRAGMALARAQNQIETHSGIGGCDLPDVADIRVLVRHQYIEEVEGSNPETGQGYDVGVQVSDQRGDQYQCTSEPQYAMPGIVSLPEVGNWFQVFNCESKNDSYIFFSEATYTITIRSTNDTSLDAAQLPSIWFANFADTYRDTSTLDQQGYMSSVVPWLVPPWKMTGGRHVNGTIIAFNL
ncbi:hypothetical protein FRC09_020479 [Ceratobasidium sp. 395]|nr:hypothetical protein FRC09_020479 [Ceratobasidium sp. 395]